MNQLIKKAQVAAAGLRKVIDESKNATKNAEKMIQLLKDRIAEVKQRHPELF